MATNVVASRPPERRPTATPTLVPILEIIVIGEVIRELPWYDNTQYLSIKFFRSSFFMRLSSLLYSSSFLESFSFLGSFYFLRGGVKIENQEHLGPPTFGTFLNFRHF